MKTKKKSGKNLRKSGKSQGKVREFNGIKKVGTLFTAFTDQMLFTGRESEREKRFSWVFPHPIPWVVASAF